MKEKFIITIEGQDEDHFQAATEQMKVFLEAMIREYNNSSPKGSKMTLDIED